MTSIIITYHNEPVEFLRACLASLRSTIDIEHEIIVVDDCSTIPLKVEGVKIVRNRENLGVGRSFDEGVKHAKGENLIIMACDIRFANNKWASNLLKEIEEHPKSLTCSACVGLWEGKMNFEQRRLISRTYGATILIFHDHKSNPKKSENYRSILDAKWHPLNKESQDRSYEIPCVLGAIYGVKKEWYKYIDGFYAHIKWGTLEPYISIKSWLFGGSCRIAPHIEIGHIFKEKGTHGHTQETIYYNKLLVANLLIDNPKRYVDFIPHTGAKVRAKQLLSQMRVDNKRSEYLSKRVMTFEEFCNKFNLDLRYENNTDGL